MDAPGQGVQLGQGLENALSMVVFSGSLDKLIASMVIATGAAASGMEVTLFFTFWGTTALRKNPTRPLKKDLMAKMFGWMLPKGSKKLPLSQMNMGGIGPEMIRFLMKKKGLSSAEELLEAAKDLGVKINICEMSMNLMGFQAGDFIDYPDIEYVGVASFLEKAARGRMTLFI